MRYWKQIMVVLLFVIFIVLVRFLVQDDYLSIDYIKEHKQALFNFIGQNYIYAVTIFILLYLCTAFFLPGALALTIAGGIAFGTLPAMLFVNIAATTGATLAFLATRFVIGDWLQVVFRDQLHRFNNELARHGHMYLLTLRILPIIPFFVVNYCAAVTRIPLSTFIWTTSVGILPGSFIYSFVGEQMRSVAGAEDVFSWKIVSALVLLCLFILLPVILHHLPVRRR